jgi:hypothetical protein
MDDESAVGISALRADGIELHLFLSSGSTEASLSHELLAGARMIFHI